MGIAGGNRPQGGGMRPTGQGRTGRPSGARPTVAPRPVGSRPSAPRGGRYNVPPSPKRPRNYRRNSGCANIVIGGVVVGLILLIVLLTVIRNSCTSCVSGTNSDVESLGGSSVSSAGGSVSSPTVSASDSSDSGTSSLSTVPPKPAEPVVPVLTLVKNKPANAFEPDCVVDELKWFEDVKAAGESLKFVYDKLGIQPYVVFKKHDASLLTDEDKVKYCVDWYKSHISDEDTFLLMYFAAKESDESVGYTVYYSGANAEKLAVEFKGILEDGINEYWFTELSTDDVIKYAFEYTCDRITVKTAADVLFGDDTSDGQQSDEQQDDEPSEGEPPDDDDNAE
ncbi:MAG: hypothetical protein NC299_04265 [Lachnospiraceae bacterium]|nr:hypothetical protein [Ruminococcus sp.]MCM1274562.1 hypothetical protein [Lachnospiraceae bacterium]